MGFGVSTRVSGLKLRRDLFLKRRTGIRMWFLGRTSWLTRNGCVYDFAFILLQYYILFTIINFLKKRIANAM